MNDSFNVKSFGLTKNPTINGVLQGEKWGHHNLTYAFPDIQDDFISDYLNNYDGSFTPVGIVVQEAVLDILEQIQGFTQLKFTQGEDDDSLIRFGYAEIDVSGRNVIGVSGGVSSHPILGTMAGDVWLSCNGSVNTNPIPGNSDYHTLLHEIGHSLGLKHGDQSYDGWPELPITKTGYAYSVMPYRVAPGYTSESSQEKPQSYMPADIRALQQMYGADFTVRDDVYQWSSDGYVWETIWDGGGNDTYDFSNITTDSVLTLRAGKYSVFTETAFQFYDVLTETWVYAEGNVVNALRYHKDNRSLIENVIGGSGNDTITGNLLDNYVTGGQGSDTFVFIRKFGDDVVTDFEIGVDLLRIEGHTSVTQSIREDGLHLTIDNQSILLSGISEYINEDCISVE